MFPKEQYFFSKKKKEDSKRINHNMILGIVIGWKRPRIGWIRADGSLLRPQAISQWHVDWIFLVIYPLTS